MKTIELSAITIPKRQREKHSPAHISDLKKSILSKGLLHPPVLTLSNELVAGYGRLLAIKELHEDGLAFSCDNMVIDPGWLPYISISDLNSSDLAEAELEENLLRANLSWEETARAKVLILNLRQQQYMNITRTDVAREIAEKSGKSPNAENLQLMQSELVVKHLDNPRVKNSKTLAEAHRAVQDLYSARLRADLVTKGLVKVEHQILLGDCRTILPELPSGTFDTILCDPPYGIKADEMKRTAKHLYEDDPAYGLEINKLIIKEGFRLLKPRGIAFLFCDVEHFVELRNYATQQAFTPWRCPLIWHKGAEGHAPWGKGGFVRTYEMCLFFVKGEKELKGGGSDVKEFKRPQRSTRGHAAEKPAALLGHLLSLAGDAGDMVLDPCCGSGPILEAATAQRMKCTAIELDPDYHALACARLTAHAEFELGVEEQEEETADELLV